MNVTSFEHKGIDERFWFTHIFTELTWHVKGYCWDAGYSVVSKKIPISIMSSSKKYDKSGKLWARF